MNSCLARYGFIDCSRILRRCFGSYSRVLNNTSLNSISINRTHNIGIIAHIDAGKTTTTERMLFYSGKTQRIGNVDEGDTVTDFLPSERERGITIQLAAISIQWDQNKINIIDTPGHVDFTFEVIRSLRVLDGCVTILDGVAGVEAQTEKVWKQAGHLGIPRIAYVNKMDREGAGFSRTVKEIIQKLQTKVVLCNLPYFENGSNNEFVFKGVIDVLNKTLLKWDLETDPSGNKVDVVLLEEEKESYPELFEMLSKSRESMVETMGEIDETIIDAFLENDEDYMKIPSQVLNAAIRSATIKNEITPVFCGSSFKNIGVQPLMDGVISYLPTPLEIEKPEIRSDDSNRIIKMKKKKGKAHKSNQAISLDMNPKKGLVINNDPNLTVALAFKVVTHKNRGVMTYFRVYSGKLISNSSAINTRTGKKLNVKKLLLMHGESPEPVNYISAGNIGVITGTENEIITGDTLVSSGAGSRSFSPLESSIHMLPIEIPPPLFNASIEPYTAGDLRHMNDCIQVLMREDPSLKVSVDEEMGQTILSGMGELHLEIIKERLVKDMKANARLREVAVSYKETLAKPTYKRETYALGENNSVSIDIELDSFEGDAMSSPFAEEEGAIVLEQENNIVILESSAASNKILAALEERRWKSESSLEDLQESLIQGCITALQLGGPLFGFPIHSTVVRIKAWDFPIEEKTTSPSLLLEAARKAVSKNITSINENNSTAFCVLEPVMLTKVYVNSDVLGEVLHDLTQRCQATITSIEDSNENIETASFLESESEKVYVPPDYTLNKNSLSSVDVKSNKVIVAETPLKEMIGYLLRLRSITQGRGTYDMIYLGMRRVVQSRLDAITKGYNLL